MDLYTWGNTLVLLLKENISATSLFLGLGRAQKLNFLSRSLRSALVVLRLGSRPLKFCRNILLLSYKHVALARKAQPFSFCCSLNNWAQPIKPHCNGKIKCSSLLFIFALTNWIAWQLPDLEKKIQKEAINIEIWAIKLQWGQIWLMDQYLDWCRRKTLYFALAVLMFQNLRTSNTAAALTFSRVI